MSSDAANVIQFKAHKRGASVFVDFDNSGWRENRDYERCWREVTPLVEKLCAYMQHSLPEIREMADAGHALMMNMRNPQGEIVDVGVAYSGGLARDVPAIILAVTSIGDSAVFPNVVRFLERGLAEAEARAIVLWSPTGVPQFPDWQPYWFEEGAGMVRLYDLPGAAA